MGGRGGLAKIVIGIMIMSEENMDNKPTGVGRWKEHLHY